jgi:hypothetical protein
MTSDAETFKLYMAQHQLGFRQRNEVSEMRRQFSVLAPVSLISCEKL